MFTKGVVKVMSVSGKSSYEFCGEIKKYLRKGIFEELEKNIGKCDKSDENWTKVYHQVMFARYVYLTWREMLEGLKSGVDKIHYVLVFDNESLIGDFNEKDLNCVLFALKYRNNDSIGVLEELPNMYRFRVISYISEPTGSYIEYVGDLDTHSPICDVKYGSKTIREIVEEMDSSLCEGCMDATCYKNNECYLDDRILMRQFDYLEDNEKMAMVIVFNTGFGVIGLMKCAYDETGEATCEPEAEYPS